MTVDSPPTRPNLIMEILKTVADRWVAISAALAALGSLFTFFLLFTYLHAIGHPALLGPALGATTALIPWIIIVGLMFVLYLAGLTATSAVYSSVLALFNRHPRVQRYMAVMLFLPACSGMIAMVACIIFWQRADEVSTMIIAAASVAIAMILMLLITDVRNGVKTAVGWEKAAPRWSKVLATMRFTALPFGLWSTALSATLPMWILISTFAWPSDQYGLYKFAGACLITSGLGLVPAAAYYLWRDSLWERARNVTLGVVLVTGAALVFAPATVPMIVDRAAAMTGIKDLQVSSYMIKDTYAAEDFDSQWGKVDTLRGHPVVKGFALFSLGTVLLLCPGSLAATDFSEWPIVTDACLVLDAQTTKRMPKK